MHGIIEFPLPLGPDDKIPEVEFAEKLFSGLLINRDETAISDVLLRKEVRYKELREKAELLGRYLLSIGCRVGDVVAIFSPNSIEWMIVLLAVIRIGAVPAGINCLSVAGELKYYLLKCQAKYLYTAKSLAPIALEASKNLSIQKIFVDEDFPGCVSLESLFLKDGSVIPLLPPFRTNISPSDPALILFSSGTTGLQKAVLFSQLNMKAAIIVQSKFRFRRQVTFTPMSHAVALFSLLTGLCLGQTSFILTRFDLKTYLQVLQDQQIEGISLVPPIAVLLAKSPEVDNYRLNLKHIRCGAAPLGTEVEDQLMDRFPGLIITQAYGMTETSSGCCYVPLRDGRPMFSKRKPGTVGTSMVHTQMKVVDTEVGSVLGPDKLGEICVKGPLVMLGYVGDPEATAATIDHNGWLHTGDIGFYDEDGYFYVVDRLKELIKYNAYQVAPAELEALLLSHPAVADSGVFGVPDAAAGELPRAWVVKKPEATGISETDLLQYVSDKVAPYKRLRGGIKFVSSIPKSPSGKILRREMRKDLQTGKL